MNRAIFILTLLLSFNAISQTFVVTANGLMDNSNLENNYVVLDFENKTAKELYNSSLRYINLNYKNPNEVIKGNVENDFISFNTYVSDLPFIRSMGVNMEYGTQYTTILYFRENKVKFEIVDINISNIQGAKVIFSGSAMSGQRIFDRKGKVNLEKAKQLLEDYFNTKVQVILSALSEEKKSSDW